MYETVTVDEALARGKRMVIYPALAIMFGVWILCFYLTVRVVVPPWFALVGTFLGLLLAWIYRSLVVTQWRLWAFTNVRNVHELKNRAIKKQILAPEGKFLERTEIRTTEQQAAWDNLQDKFKISDEFIEDHTVPPEIIVHFSKNKAIGAILFGMVFLAGGTWLLLTQPDSHLAGFGGLIVGAILFIMGYRHLINRDPQVILSNDGVQIAGTPFYSWAQVSNEDTVLVRSGRTRRLYFKYNCPEGEKSIQMNEFDISTADFERSLRIYRGRYTQKHT